MAIFTGNEKGIIGSEMAATTDSGDAFSRVEPLITTDQLKSRFLFGIPLYSMLADPVTRKRAEYTAEMLKDSIARAINVIELQTGICIQAVEKTRRLPFDAHEYRSLGYFILPDAPVLKVISLDVRPSGNVGAVYVIDPNWIDAGGLARGHLQIIPWLPSSIAPYSATTPAPLAGGSGGNAFLSIMGQLSWIAYQWQCCYIAGFNEGRVPYVVNELIGTVAAINVLSEIAATNRVGQYSVSLDAAQQSVNTGGVQVYQTRIEELEKSRVALSNKLKKKFKNALFCDTL